MFWVCVLFELIILVFFDDMVCVTISLVGCIIGCCLLVVLRVVFVDWFVVDCCLLFS